MLLTGRGGAQETARFVVWELGVLNLSLLWVVA